MKLIKQSYEILEQEIPAHKMDDYSGSHFREEYIHNMYKHIERCGRTCYKSTDRITEDSAERFVNGLIKSKHLSVLEHGVIYLNVSGSDDYIRTRYSLNKYSIHHDEYFKGEQYITTNYRVIIENGWEEDLQYLCEPTEYHELRHTVLFHGCIHTYKDLTRHRKASFSIESTRYCNYSKTDKFGEMKFVLPPWVNIQEGVHTDVGNVVNEINNATLESDIANFKACLLNCEIIYNRLIKQGWQPQQAAEILPQCTAADVVITAYDSDWKFIFDLRSDTAATGKPHPLVEELMTPLRDEFKEKGWI